MSQLLFDAFLVLMGAQGLGTATFLAIYLRGDWRSSPVGRHLVLYAAALLFLYVTTFASFFIHALWLVLLVLAGHVVFAAAIWQRVWLVWQAHRSSTTDA